MKITIPYSLELTVLGMCVVFLVLVFLMVIIYIMSAVVKKAAAMSAVAVTEAPAGAEIPEADLEPEPVPENSDPSVYKPPAINSYTPAPDSGEGVVAAPVPGKVLSVNVKLGDIVKAGQLILLLEAMKMENEITAPKAGVIVSVAALGSNVQTGDELVKIGYGEDYQ